MLRRWLRRLVGPKPPGFRFECLQDGRWLCLLCDRSVQDTQMGFHAKTRHGWQAPDVKIQPHERSAAE